MILTKDISTFHFYKIFDDSHKIITFFYNLENRWLIFQYHKNWFYGILLKFIEIKIQRILILNFMKSWNVWKTSLQIWLQNTQISIQSIFELCFASNRKTINCLRPSFKWLARFLFATEQNTMMKAHFSMICFSHK